MRRTPFAHLLIYVLDKGLTGSIEFHPRADAPAALVLRDGMTVKARAPAPSPLLGDVLVRRGSLSGAQRDAAVRAAAASKTLLGRHLVRERLLSQSALVEALGAQLLLCLRRMFRLEPDTTYAFYEGFDALAVIDADDAPPADPYRVLWPALLEAPPREHLEQTLAQARDKFFRFRQGVDVDKFAFDERVLPLVERLREKPSRLVELQGLGGVDPRHAETLLYVLLITKHVHAVVPSVPPASRAAVPSYPPLAPTGSVQSFAAADARASASRVSIANTKVAPRALGSVPPSLPPEHVARWEEIILRATNIDKEDYFEMLGVGRTATADQVQAAFLALAKQWHPDRLPPPLAPLKEECARVFARLGEAQQTLLDGERRGRYMTLLADGGATPEDQESIAAVVEAATNFQKAEVFLKKNDLVRAELFCGRALDADPQGDYLALLAWVESLKPENQTTKATLDRVAMLDRAVAQSKDRCERAFFYRGMLYKKLQNTASAVRDFRKAAELNPRNLDAIREVRLYELRRSKGANAAADASAEPGAARVSFPNASAPTVMTSRSAEAKPSAGFFGRLFKK